MKDLTTKQTVAVAREIKNVSQKMRGNGNDPHMVIGFYTAKIELLTNLIINGYDDTQDFEQIFNRISKHELTSNEASN